MAERYLAHQDKFLTYFGLFQVAWSGAEICVDMALRDFLRLTDDEAHLLTAGLEFNRKATLLRTLIAKSNHKNKGKAIEALNTMQNEGKRNVFAHSYIKSGPDHVTFATRARGGAYKVEEHRFTQSEFSAHVESFSNAATAFQLALEQSNEDVDAFCLAALNVKRSA